MRRILALEIFRIYDAYKLEFFSLNAPWQILKFPTQIKLLV